MKKRIIAVFLAFSVLVGSLSITKRASAVAGALGTGLTIFVIAWEILDIMTKGEEPGMIVFIRTLLEEGEDFITNPENPVRQTFADLWDEYGVAFDNVSDALLDMYNNGELTIKNGQAQLTYDQYLQLFNIAYSFVPNIGIEFNTSYYYFAFEYSLGSSLPILTLPVNDVYYKSSYGQSYSLIFYDNKKVVFSDTYVQFYENSSGIGFNSKYLNSNNESGLTQPFSFHYLGTTEAAVDLNYRISFKSLSSFSFKWYSFGDITRDIPVNYCYVLSDGVLSRQPVTAVDVSGCNTAIVSSTGDYPSFLQSISSATVTDTVACLLPARVLSSVLYQWVICVITVLSNTKIKFAVFVGTMSRFFLIAPVSVYPIICLNSFFKILNHAPGSIVYILICSAILSLLIILQTAAIWRHFGLFSVIATFKLLKCIYILHLISNCPDLDFILIAICLRLKVRHLFDKSPNTAKAHCKR